jgi:hypothetical protein
MVAVVTDVLRRTHELDTIPEAGMMMIAGIVYGISRCYRCAGRGQIF